MNRRTRRRQARKRVNVATTRGSVNVVHRGAWREHRLFKRFAKFDRTR